MYYYYKIENKVNHNLYVGITINPDRRKRTHFTKLRNHNHHNAYLQAAFDKYGEENFFFEILEQHDFQEKEAYEYEQVMIAKYDSFQNGYNLDKGGHCGRQNRIFSEEEIYQILAANCYSHRVGTVIANELGRPRGTIRNILQGTNYREFFLKFQDMSEEDKMMYYELFCERTNFALDKYKANTKSCRKYSKEDIFLVLSVDELHYMTWKRVRGILNTTISGLKHIREGISYPDYYHEYQALSKNEKLKLQSLYTEKYIE